MPGEIYFSQKEIKASKKIIKDAQDLWKNNNNYKYKSTIFIETSSTKINHKTFGIKQKNKDWGIENWKKLLVKLKKDYLLIQSIHKESKKRLKFFNLGKKNDWKNLLDPKIEEQIRFKFNKEMKELGYN